MSHVSDNLARISRDLIQHSRSLQSPPPIPFQSGCGILKLYGPGEYFFFAFPIPGQYISQIDGPSTYSVIPQAQSSTSRQPHGRCFIINPYLSIVFKPPCCSPHP
jgi:hypothetical protein